MSKNIVILGKAGTNENYIPFSLDDNGVVYTQNAPNSNAGIIQGYDQTLGGVDISAVVGVNKNELATNDEQTHTLLEQFQFSSSQALIVDIGKNIEITGINISFPTSITATVDNQYLITRPEGQYGTGFLPISVDSQGNIKVVSDTLATEATLQSTNTILQNEILAGLTAQTPLLQNIDTTLITLNNKVSINGSGEILVYNSNIQDTPLISGFNLETTQDAIKTKTDNLSFFNNSGNLELSVFDTQNNQQLSTLNTTLSNLPTNTFDVSIVNTEPIQITGIQFPTSITVSNFPATQPISGTVAVSNTGFNVNNFPATQPVSISSGITVNNFPATQPISGTVAVSNTSFEVSNFPAVQPVSGTVIVGNMPGTQPISGSVSILNFPATQAVSFNSGITVNNFPTVQDVLITNTEPIAITGINFPATQPISGSVSISNFPAVQPVSFDSGITVLNFPTTQPISGSVSVSNFPATQPVSFDSGITVLNFPATQPISGSILVSNFPATQPVSFDSGITVLNFPATQPISGTVAVSNTGFNVNNFPATQPVSISSGITVNNFPATQPISGSVSVSNFPTTQPISGSVSVSNFPAVQPVSISSGITVLNSSIDTHCYASSNGTTWHHLQSDSNGILNVHSRTQDGNGTDITSTDLLSGKTGLDTASSLFGYSGSTRTALICDIPGKLLTNSYTSDTNGNGIDSTLTATSQRSLNSASSLYTSTGSARTALTSTLNGAKQSLDVNVSNSLVGITGNVNIYGNDGTGTRIVSVDSNGRVKTNSNTYSGTGIPITYTDTTAITQSLDCASSIYVADGTTRTAITATGSSLNTNITNQISGFALNTTLTTTNSKIDTTNSTLTTTNTQINTSNGYLNTINQGVGFNYNYTPALNNVSIAANTIYSTFSSWTKGQFRNTVIVYSDSSTANIDSVSLYAKDEAASTVFLGTFYPFIQASSRQYTLTFNLSPFYQISVRNNSSSSISNVFLVLYSA